jgi:hypothetical protein
VNWVTEELHKQVDAHLAPIARDYGLTLSTENHGSSGSVTYAKGDHFSICLESDHGCLSFQIAPNQDRATYWSIDVVSTLFPPIRLLNSGTQRLTLSEQAEFIRSNWQALTSLFDRDTYRFTQARLVRAGPRV